MLTANWVPVLRLMLRRDRVSLPVWLISVWLFCVIFVPMFPGMAGTSEEIATLGEMMKNPAMVAMCGLIYGDAYTYGVMYTQLMLVWSGLLVAVMNILIVVRHTRGEEDEGRLEVVRALPAGRLSSLMATTGLVIGLNVLLALLTGFSMPLFGVASIDLAGSLVYGAALGAVGLVFAGITLVVVQLVHSAGAATGTSLALLGAFYVLRAYGDVGSEWAGRVSPLGLIERTYPYYSNLWWPVVTLLLACAVLIAAAFGLAGRRDLGRGLLPEAGGRRAHASRWLADEWGLAWRLTRGTILAWGVAVFLLAAAYGSVMSDMENFVQSNQLYQLLVGIGAGTTNAVGPVTSNLLLMMGMLGTIPVLTTAFKLHAEERSGRLDAVLGKSVSRVRLYGGYALLVLLVAIAMQLLAAIGFWTVARMVMTNPVSASLVLKAAFVYGAGLLAFGGLGLLLVGVAKRLTWIAWAYLAVTFVVVYLGGLVNLPHWVQKLTPFGLLPSWPTEPFSWWSWAALAIGAFALAVVGGVGYRRRDVTA